VLSLLAAVKVQKDKKVKKKKEDAPSPSSTTDNEIDAKEGEQGRVSPFEKIDVAVTKPGVTKKSKPAPATSRWQQEEAEKKARLEAKRRQARLDQKWLDEQREKYATINAADRLARARDDARAARNFWIGIGGDHSQQQQEEGRYFAQQANSVDAQQGDFATAAGTLHASVSLAGTETFAFVEATSTHAEQQQPPPLTGSAAGQLLSTGVVPWLRGKEGCSEFFRSLGESAHDPCRPTDTYEPTHPTTR
jgi:hypothetical protein